MSPVTSLDLDDLLISRIVSGRVSVEDHMDERAIGLEFGERRVDVRATLSRLSESGVVTRARRVGTSPANRPTVYNSVKLADSLPPSPRTYRTIDVARIRASASLASEFDVASGTLLTRVHRVAMLGEQVAEWWTIWSVVDLPSALGEDGFPDDLNWYDVVGRATGHERLNIKRLSFSLRASGPDAEFFDIDVGDPLLFVDRTLRSEDGAFIDRSFGRIPGARAVTIIESTLDLKTRRGYTRVDPD